jgi:AraC-like DNA-binding protein
MRGEPSARTRAAASRPRVPIIHPYVPQTPDRLFVEAQWVDRDHPLRRMGLHGHSFFELLLIERGHGRHGLGKTFHNVGPGSLLMIAPGELHDATDLGDAEGWVLLFTHQALEGDAASMAFCWSWLPRHPLFVPFLTLGRHRDAPLRVGDRDLATWSHHMREIARETAARAPGYRFGVHAHLSLLLLSLLRLAGPGAPIGPPAEDPVLDAVFDFIERRYRHPIGLADLARAAGRSASHLTTVLRRRTGLSASEWVTERRMSEARRLLVATDLKLGDIARRTGYGEPESLIRSFRRLHRMTPAAWRARHRGDPAWR